MTYLFIFLAFWFVLVLLAKLILRWPDEAKEIRESYPKKTILLGFLSPKFARTKFSDDHLRILVQFRRRYIVYWASILVVATILIVVFQYHLANESQDFYDTMHEKYIDKKSD